MRMMPASFLPPSGFSLVGSWEKGYLISSPGVLLPYPVSMDSVISRVGFRSRFFQRCHILERQTFAGPPAGLFRIDPDVFVADFQSRAHSGFELSGREVVPGEVVELPALLLPATVHPDPKARIPEPGDHCHMPQNDKLGNRMKRSYEPHRPWWYNQNWLMRPWPARIKNRLPIQIVGISVPLHWDEAQNERHPDRPDQAVSLYGDVTQSSALIAAIALW